MEIEKLIEQLNDWNEKYISNLCGDRTIKCEEYCIKDDCLIVKAATALSTLQAENEKLRAELENYRKDHCSEGGCAAEKDRDLVIAENKKLRAELEQVKAERDAAVESIPHECKTCVYHTVFFNGCTPDHDCTNPDGGCSNNYDRWQWRGQRED